MTNESLGKKAEHKIKDGDMSLIILSIKFLATGSFEASIDLSNAKMVQL